MTLSVIAVIPLGHEVSSRQRPKEAGRTRVDATKATGGVWDAQYMQMTLSGQGQDWRFRRVSERTFELVKTDVCNTKSPPP